MSLKKSGNLSSCCKTSISVELRTYTSEVASPCSSHRPARHRHAENAGWSLAIREEAHLHDFSLKQSLVLLFLLMRQTGDGKILTIQVRHGLPVTVEIERLRNR